MLEADNVTYSESYPLNFTVNKPTQWIGYSLDEKANVTVSGNMTLHRLPSGLHNLTIYAIDDYGVEGASNTVHFTVKEPFPSLLVAAVVLSAAGFAACFLFYKRKNAKNPSQAGFACMA
jgi:hypothetical protein